MSLHEIAMLIAVSCLSPVMTQTCIVSTLDGEAGNWAELKGNEALRPTGLKGPIPQNFTITYDVVVPQKAMARA